MSVRNRVTRSWLALAADDPEEALFQICAAVEMTARAEGRLPGRGTYKAFIRDNMPIIATLGVGPALAGIRFTFAHPDLCPCSEDGTIGLEDVTYHLLRCGLYHTAQLPPEIEFTDNKLGPTTEGRLLLPKGLIAGLIIAVVASPSNAAERTDPVFWLECHGTRFLLNDLWGTRDSTVAQLIS